MFINILITILAMIMHNASAATTTLTCPPVIKTGQSLQEKITGWDNFTDEWNSIYRFNGIAFYDGHPREHASLAPDSKDSKSNKLIWTFANKEIWLACTYLNTSIQLIRKLPAASKSCTVNYDARFSQPGNINCV